MGRAMWVRERAAGALPRAVGENRPRHSVASNDGDHRLVHEAAPRAKIESEGHGAYRDEQGGRPSPASGARSGRRPEPSPLPLKCNHPDLSELNDAYRCRGRFSPTARGLRVCPRTKCVCACACACYGVVATSRCNCKSCRRLRVARALLSEYITSQHNTTRQHSPNAPREEAVGEKGAQGERAHNSQWMRVP